MCKEKQVKKDFGPKEKSGDQVQNVSGHLKLCKTDPLDTLKPSKNIKTYTNVILSRKHNLLILLCIFFL